MSGTQHSKTPWYVDPGDPCVIRSDRTGNDIGFVAMTLPDVSLGWNGTEETEANARHIVECVNRFGGYGDSHFLEVEPGMEWNCLQVAIDGLIDHLADCAAEFRNEDARIIRERLDAARSLKAKLSEEPARRPVHLRDLKSEDLDELVQEAASRMASNANNDGLGNQLDFLYQAGWSDQDILDAVNGKSDED